MTSEAPFLHCRLCGIRYRSDKVIDHERQCSYQNPTPSSSSKNKEELAPASSKDSRVNELRDNEEYYKQETRTTGSSENQPKDLTSNEESDDSPLNLANRGGMSVHEVRESSECHEEPAYSHSRSETKVTRPESAISSNNRPPECHSETEIKTTHDESNDCEMRTETKTYYGPDGRVIKTESKTTHHDPESHESRSETKNPYKSDEEKLDEALVFSSQNKARPPPNLSSSSGGMSVHHQKSHMNEKASVKIDSKSNDNVKASPQKSNEEQKEAMITTPYPSEEDIKIPSVAADEVGEAVDMLEHLPELSEQAEMAYEQHKKSLVPCTHCERTFRPDRLAIHERACIERPKTREYIVPEDK